MSPRATGLALSVALHGAALAAALALVRLAAPPEPIDWGMEVELVVVATAPTPHPDPPPQGGREDAVPSSSPPAAVPNPPPPKPVRVETASKPASPPPLRGRDREGGESEVAAVPIVPASLPPAAAGSPPPGSTAAAWNDPALGNAPPDYPELARRRGWEGRVLLKVAVSLVGDAVAVEVARPSGFETLDEAARRAVAAWRFRPATVAGVPVAGSVEVPVTFRLTE